MGLKISYFQFDPDGNSKFDVHSNMTCSFKFALPTMLTKESSFTSRPSSQIASFNLEAQKTLLKAVGGLVEAADMPHNRERNNGVES